jgi:hypothetical protein
MKMVEGLVSFVLIYICVAIFLIFKNPIAIYAASFCIGYFARWMWVDSGNDEDGLT